MYRPCNYMTCICFLLFFSLFFKALLWPQYYIQNDVFIVWVTRKLDGSLNTQLSETCDFWRAWSACSSKHHHILSVSVQKIKSYFWIISTTEQAVPYVLVLLVFQWNVNGKIRVCFGFYWWSLIEIYVFNTMLSKYWSFKSIKYV